MMKTGGNQEGESETEHINNKNQNLCAKIPRCLWNSFWFIGNAPEARFAGWVARLTLVLCLVGIVQVWAFIQSERAYVSPAAARFAGGDLVADAPVELWVELRNSGRSAAAIGTMNITYRFGKLPLIPEYNLRGNTAVPSIVAGGTVQTFHKSFLPDGKPFVFNKQVVDAIKNSTIELYAFGFVTFTDDFSVFGNKRVGFCFAYNPKGTIASSLFNNCSEKNYSYSDGQWFKY